MFSYIKGNLEYISEDAIIIDNGGIGFSIITSSNVLSKLPPLHSEVKILTYLQVKEDGLTLFGFLKEDELDLFKKLISISGIGPKGAISILSTLTTDELRMAILSEDSKAIAKANGIGARTAQRVIIDLKDKISIVPAGFSDEEIIESKNDASNSAVNDVVLALASLGYSNVDAMKAVKKVEGRDNMDVEQLLKAALKKM